MTAATLVCLLLAASAVSARGAAAEASPGTVVAGSQAASQGAQEVVREIRIHGNYATPDAEVIRLAGLTIGQALDASSVPDARARLERSRRFESVDIRKRYRSLDDPTDVALVIVVQEHPTADVGPSALGPIGRTLGSAMFMPILDFTDGYGFTYGARVSFVEGLGQGGRLSVPFTWGGSKRLAAELQKTMTGGPIDTVTASASLSRRTNPHYEIDDERGGVMFGASRKINRALRAGGHAGFSAVTFGALHDQLGRYGLDATLDTRADPAFPRNAVLATVGWEYLDFRTAAPAHVVRIDARGFVGVIGQAVLSLRTQFARANGPLPPYERLLLGGAESLRGYRTGTFAGDSTLAASAELRVPVSSPLSFARAGVDVFADVGTTVDHGTPLRTATFHPGFGGGVFMVASIFHLNADVAVRRGGGVRLHVMSGLHF